MRAVLSPCPTTCTYAIDQAIADELTRIPASLLAHELEGSGHMGILRTWFNEARGGTYPVVLG